MILAETWNGYYDGLPGSGDLWRCSWHWTEEKGHYSQVSAPGVFAGPVSYESGEKFWEAYSKDAETFNGRVNQEAIQEQIAALRAGGSPDELGLDTPERG